MPAGVHAHGVRPEPSAQADITFPVPRIHFNRPGSDAAQRRITLSTDLARASARAYNARPGGRRIRPGSSSHPCVPAPDVPTSMSEREALVLSWSGGKDSALALARLREQDGVRVVGLMTTVTEGYDRVSIHGVRRALLHAQAAAVGLPLHEVALQPQSSNEAYERATADALARVRQALPDVHRLAFGDIFLQDVRQYREHLVGGLGFGAVFPLWGEAPADLAGEVMQRGIRARLVCVDTQQLDASFAGRTYDAALLADLPPGTDPCGERGEFHTFVSDGPAFRVPVPYETGEVVLRDGRFAYCDLLPVNPSPRTLPSSR